MSQDDQPPCRRTRSLDFDILDDVGMLKQDSRFKKILGEHIPPRRKFSNIHQLQMVSPLLDEGASSQAMNSSRKDVDGPESPTRNFGRQSQLEKERSQEEPELPKTLAAPSARFELMEESSVIYASSMCKEVAKEFPSLGQLKPLRLTATLAEDTLAAQRETLQRVGVACLSSTTAAAGTLNVILGLRRFLGDEKSLCGILSLSKGETVNLFWKDVKFYLNQGGSDLLPMIPVMRVNDRLVTQLKSLNLDSLVFIGGAADLLEIAKIAELLASSPIRLIGVLHSASGLIRAPPFLSTSLGFDSAACVLAEISGDLALSRRSVNRDLYHFICCGSSELTLEVAMQARPAMCIIGDDVAIRGATLQGILDEICDMIISRHHDYGLHACMILVSDDLFEKLVELRCLREAFHRLRLEQPGNILTHEHVAQLLPTNLASAFRLLPGDVRHQLVFRSDAEGMPLLKVGEAEREIASLVTRLLNDRDKEGKRSVKTFVCVPHSLRQISSSAMPTPLDCAMGYALGHAAGLMLKQGLHGYIADMADILKPCSEWGVLAVPMVNLLEPRSGAEQKVETITSRRNRLEPGDALFDLWREVQELWRYEQSYRQPGPLQFWGPSRCGDSAWASYTLRAQAAQREQNLSKLEALARDAGRGLKFPEPILVHRIKLSSRVEQMLSPLQRWRLDYVPKLPAVLQKPFWVSEAMHRRTSRVCSDIGVIRRAFPSLARQGCLVPLVMEPVVKNADSFVDIEQGAMRHGMLQHSNAGINALLGENVILGGLARTPPPKSRAGLRIGCVLLGRSGPGVNNVVWGIFDYLKKCGGTLLGVPDGIVGLTGGAAFEVTEELLQPFRNQGGCDIMGQSEPEELLTYGEDLPACLAAVKKHRLDGLVVWGGTLVHSWTPRLAEYFAQHDVPTSVIGVPASVQSDLPLIEQTLGYDTMCKLLASVLGNLSTEAASIGKMWFFVRIAGKSISHISAEVALRTHPHVVFTETTSGRIGVAEVTSMICDVVEARSRECKNYGLVLIPDQMAECVVELRQLIKELAQIHRMAPDKLKGVGAAVDDGNFGPLFNLLSPMSRSLMQSFPQRIVLQFCSIFEGGRVVRDVEKAAETVDLSKVETEVVFQKLVETELTRRVVLKTYRGPFHSMPFSLNAIGRSSMPTNFDCDLGYTIGYAAGALIDEQHTGLLVDITSLKEEVDKWEVGGTPFSSFLTFYDGSELQKFRKTVSGDWNKCSGPEHLSYKICTRTRLRYDVGSGSNLPPPCDRSVVSPGPTQFDGPCAGAKTQSLSMPNMQRVRQMERTELLIAELKQLAAAGSPPELLQAVKTLLHSGAQLLRKYHSEERAYAGN